MRRENEKLVIDKNTIYELDLECVRNKQKEQEKKNQNKRNKPEKDAKR